MPNVNPQVSVILINYNKPEMTADCVRSVIEHTSGVSYEIIVVDNASTEGDITGIDKIDSRVRLVRNETNSGFSKGNNFGIKSAVGDVILLLNNDTLLQNDAISICYQLLISNKRIGVVGSSLFYADGTRQLSAERFPSLSILTKQFLRLYKLSSPGKLGLNYNLEVAEPINVDWVWGTFFMFPKVLLAEFPGQQLPDEFFMYSEDLQWGHEFRNRGYEIMYCPAARVTHLESKNSFKNRMVIHNNKILLRRYHNRVYCFLYESINNLNLAFNSFKNLFVSRSR